MNYRAIILSLILSTHVAASAKTYISCYFDDKGTEAIVDYLVYNKELPYKSSSDKNFFNLTQTASGHNLSNKLNSYFYVATTEDVNALYDLCSSKEGGRNLTEVRVTGRVARHTILFKGHSSDGTEHFYRFKNTEKNLNMKKFLEEKLQIIQEKKTPTINMDTVFKAARLAQAIYKRDEINERLKGIGEVISLQVSQSSYSNDQDLASIMLKNNQNELELWFTFKGTDTLGNWAINFNAFPMMASIFEAPKAKNKNGSVHTGFYTASKAYRENVEAQINLYLDITKKQKQDITINITGHSLGGAQAIATAYYLMSKDYKVNLITFAAPILGSADVAAQIENLRIKTDGHILRIVHNDDIVPKVGLNGSYWRVNFAQSSNGFGHSLNLGNYRSLRFYNHIMASYIESLEKCKTTVQFNTTKDLFICANDDERALHTDTDRDMVQFILKHDNRNIQKTISEKQQDLRESIAQDVSATSSIDAMSEEQLEEISQNMALDVINQMNEKESN